MRVAIAIDPEMRDMKELESAIEGSGFEVTEVLTNGARGKRNLVAVWAESREVPILRVPIRSWSPRWTLWNQKAALFAEGGIAIWDGISPKARGFIEAMSRQGKQVHVRIVNPVVRRREEMCRRKEADGSCWTYADIDWIFNGSGDPPPPVYPNALPGSPVQEEEPAR